MPSANQHVLVPIGWDRITKRGFINWPHMPCHLSRATGKSSQLPPASVLQLPLSRGLCFFDPLTHPARERLINSTKKTNRFRTYEDRTNYA